jgi:LysR family transcriptional regulator, low CO2-responsive transcriptional regulator
MQLFLALVETGSVTAAARAVHVTQPTATMQLQKVAESVGLPLYEVISKKVHLTEAGRELAHVARSIANEWESFDQKMDALRGLTRGRLRVAMVSTAKYFVPRLLGEFCGQHPNIEIALEVLNRSGVVQRLRDNLDDMYIMSMPPTDLDIVSHVFIPNPLVMIAASSHPLLQQSGVQWSALENERFILRERGSGTRMAVDQFFKDHHFKPHVRLELGSNEAVKEAVAGNLGVSVVSRHTLSGNLNHHGVAELRVEGFPIQSNWFIVYPKTKQLSPIAKVFLQHLLAQRHD